MLAEIGTYHLPDEERLRYVVSNGRGSQDRYDRWYEDKKNHLKSFKHRPPISLLENLIINVTKKKILDFIAHYISSFRYF